MKKEEHASCHSLKTRIFCLLIKPDFNFDVKICRKISDQHLIQYQLIALTMRNRFKQSSFKPHNKSVSKCFGIRLSVCLMTNWLVIVVIVIAGHLYNLTSNKQWFFCVPANKDIITKEWNKIKKQRMKEGTFIDFTTGVGS